MRENNSGFSLIELVVALAIVAIVTGAIMGFAVISSNTYQRQNKEVELQYESQLAMNQLQELTIDASKGIAYSVDYTTGGSVDTVMILKDSDLDPAIVGNINSKQLTIYNQGQYYIVKWDIDAEKLLYTQRHKKSVSENIFIDDAVEVLMAEYVKGFEVDLSQMDKNGSVCLKLTFNRDKDYEVTQNVYLRNKVAVNPTLGEMY